MDFTDDLNPYEYSQEIELEDEFADICVTTEEMDAMVLCKFIIDSYRDEYDHAVALAPHDTAGRQNALNKLISEAKNQQEVDDILMEWQAYYNWRSSVKDIKYNIIDAVTKTMIDAGIGKNRRKKLLPKLTEYLLKN